MRRALSLAVVVVVACGDRRPSPPPPGDAGTARRHIEHPRSAVYSRPPHLIEPGRMGPFKLGETLASVLYAIPPGPGVEVLDIPHVIRLSVIRVEDGKMTVGADPALVSFVSVVAPEVARTEAGIEVGATRDAVIQALGRPVVDPRHAIDPRLLGVAPVPGLRFVIESDKVVAAMLTAPPSAPGETEPPAPVCTIDRSDEGKDALHAALGGDAAAIDCLSTTEAVAAVDDDIVVISAGDKPRKLYSSHVAGLVFARATHTGGKDEIIGVTRDRNDKRAEWRVFAARWDAGRIVKTVDEDVYQLTGQSAGWIGAELEDLDLVLDVEARADTLVASGVLLDRGGSAIRFAVPIEPISVTRRKRTVPEAGTAGSGDASVQPLGDAAPGTDAPHP